MSRESASYIERKPSVVGIRHVLAENERYFSDLKDNLLENIPENHRIGYELTPYQLEKVSDIVRILDNGTDLVYDSSLDFAIELYKLAKTLELTIVPIDDEDLFNQQMIISEKSSYPFLKSDAENKELELEWKLVDLERSAKIGHRSKEEKLDLSFIGISHMVDLNCILLWQEANYVSLLADEITREHYRFSMKILENEQNKIDGFKEQYLPLDHTK